VVELIIADAVKLHRCSRRHHEVERAEPIGRGSENGGGNPPAAIDCGLR
jgi:hypothetical protein